jgi:hypothetical protein
LQVHKIIMKLEPFLKFHSIVLILPSLFLFFSCHESRSCLKSRDLSTYNEWADTIIESETHNNILKLRYTQKILLSETFALEIENISNYEIFIYYSSFKDIEKKYGNTWIKVKILYCPCGQDCGAPPSKKVISSHQKYRLNWNLQEGWCEKDSNNEFITNEFKVTPGLYRINITYSETGRAERTITTEFEITA